MKQELYLQIPKPCHENWDAMTAVDKGKFCSSCSKEVVDFSLLTDAEVLNYFKKSTGTTCGRFSNDQLQRPLLETKIEKRKRWKWMLASVTSLIMIDRTQSQKKGIPNELLGKVITVQPKEATPKAKVAAKLKADTTSIKTSPPVIKKILPEDDTIGIFYIAPGKGNTKIEGYVVDEKNSPIAYASVYTTENKISGVTDKQGHFEITTDIKENKLQLSFKSFGFADEDTLIDLQAKQPVLKISMKPKVVELPKVTVVSNVIPRCTMLTGSIVATSYQKISTKDTVIAFVRKVLDTVKLVENTFRIYPNPAVKNSTLHIEIKDAGSYQVQLFDNTSRLLQAGERITTVKQESIPFQLPANIASGFYYIRLINRQTGKSYTDKVIVQ